MGSIWVSFLCYVLINLLSRNVFWHFQFWNANRPFWIFKMFYPPKEGKWLRSPDGVQLIFLMIIVISEQNLNKGPICQWESTILISWETFISRRKSSLALPNPDEFELIFFLNHCFIHEQKLRFQFVNKNLPKKFVRESLSRGWV